MSKNLVYDIRDKPKFSKMIVFAFQQLLAIIAATIAVSGLKMIQKVDLEDHANLFTVSVILITGIGGMSMAIGKVVITAIACALILGILTNTLLHKFKK